MNVSLALLLCTCFCIFQEATAQESRSRGGDLALFRAEFLERDNSFSVKEKAEAEGLLLALEAAPGALVVVQ